ncbi:MAG: dihydroorotase [Candidatus Sumerlaeota bacterium]|nr:dihydroorotase [Candidatus Sumerlaeota bacterium]
MTRTLISNGTVIDPAQGIHAQLDVLVEDGRVLDMQRTIAAEQAAEVIDASGLVVAPGFVDLHVHLREPGGEGAETIASGTRAAAFGGFTTIYAMPNTNPVCDTQTGVAYVLSRAASEGLVKVVPIAAVTIGQQGTDLTNLGALKDAGAGAFSDDGHPIMNAEIMRRVLEYTRVLERPVFEHCEDLNLTGQGVMHEGLVSLQLGLKGIPRVSESIIVARNVALAAATGGHIHICHVSARESVEAIREGKRSGVRVTAEVTPHHLTMTDEAVRGYDTHAKMKPPLCAEEDRLALVAGLEDGTIDCIATDHAPHSSTAKNNVFDAAPFGIIGMESAFPVLYTTFVETGQWTLDFLIERMTNAPAKIVDRRIGSLQTGMPADIVLLEMGTEYTFDASYIGSKSSNCPWLGQRLKGRIAATMVDGRIVHRREDAFGGVKTAPRKRAAGKRK